MDQRVTYWVRDLCSNMLLSGKWDKGNADGKVQHAAEISKSGLTKLLVYLGISRVTNSVTGVADTCVRAYLRTCVVTYVRICVCAYLHMCVCLYLCMCVLAYVRICVCPYVRICIRAYVRMCAFAYVRMSVCAHLRT
jgi:hypothetical protein